MLLVTVCATEPGVAQEFHPPPVRRAGEQGTRLGLFGFGMRAGIDTRRPTQLILGATFDAGNLFSDRCRIRPSAEIGVFNARNSYVASIEAVYRLTPEGQHATPYVGGGLSVAGHDRCGSDPACPGVWLNALLGVELHYRSTFSWLFEYHAMDVFQHNRLYVGLTTRRGS